MTTNYGSTVPYSEDNYTIIWKQPLYNGTATDSRKHAPSIFDFDLVKVNDYSLCNNIKPKGECWKYDNRHKRRKERALKREKPRLSKRRHKHAK